MQVSLFVWPKHWVRFSVLLGMAWAVVLGVAQPAVAAEPLPRVSVLGADVEGVDLRVAFTTEDEPSLLQIERATSSNGPWAVLAELPGNATSYLDTDMVAGPTYHYRVRGFHADVAGDYSNSTSAMLGKASFASERFMLTVSRDGVVSIQPFHAGWAGSLAVERRTLGAVEWSEIGVTPPGSRELFWDSNTEPGATYEYRFVTLPATKEGGVSAAFAREIPAYDVPGTPGNFAFAGSSETQISLSWLDAGYEQGYRLERRRHDEFEWSLLTTLPANTNAYTDTSVTSGSGYWYRMTAFNDLGDGPSRMTPLIRAKSVPVVIEDDFDPVVDGTQWAVQKGVTLSEPDAPGNTSRFVLLSQSGERSMETAAFDASVGGSIEFSYRGYPGAAYTGSAALNTLEVEGQILGSLWLPLMYVPSLPTNNNEWKNTSVSVPPHLTTAGIKIRWRQGAGDAENLAWGLDNVRIRAMADDTIKLLTKPMPQLVRVGDAVTLSTEVNRATATFQWYKDGVAVEEATAATYAVASAQAAHAGRYICEIRYKDVVERTEPVTVVVVAMNGQEGLVKTAEGGEMELEVRVHPADMAGQLSYVWSTTAVGGFPAAGEVSGQDTARLRVAGATLAAEADYHC